MTNETTSPGEGTPGQPQNAEGRKSETDAQKGGTMTNETTSPGEGTPGQPQNAEGRKSETEREEREKKLADLNKAIGEVSKRMFDLEGWIKSAPSDNIERLTELAVEYRTLREQWRYLHGRLWGLSEALGIPYLPPDSFIIKRQ
jgi:hypothetical protein